MRINLGAVPSCILDACLERSVCLSVFFVYCLYAYVCPFANSLVFFIRCEYGVIWIHVYFRPVFIAYVTRLTCLVSGSFFAD